MPTADRRDFLVSALKCYQKQDWQEKELIVVDDGYDIVKDLCEGVPGVTYYRPVMSEFYPTRQSIGAKRNIANRLGKGSVFIHFDDDDWSASDRITKQVKTMNSSGKSVVGFYSLLFFDSREKQLYKYTHPSTEYSCGSSLCYTREFWEQHNFECKNIGEDNAFVVKARINNQIHSVDGEKTMVARVHGNNTSEYRLTDGNWWQTLPLEELPVEFLEAKATSAG
jgi:glycosyltransferase involved in cell wall biosynthesis